LSSNQFIAALICIITLSFSGIAQFELDRKLSFEKPREHFRVDELGYYTFFDKDMIEKYDTNSVRLFRQSVKTSGKIDCIDVSNPMKPLVFFREQQVITFLDNTLTPYQNTTKLSDLGISYGTLVCYSTQSDRFWVYDQDNSKLVLFLQNGKKHLETENLAGLLDIQNPIQLIERNSLLYLVDEFHGVFVFDMYGTFVEFFELPTIQWIQVDEHNIYYLTESSLYSLHRKTRISLTTQIDSVKGVEFQYSKKRFYFTVGKQILVCEIIPQKK